VDVEAIAAVAAAGLPGLDAPSKTNMGDALAVFQHQHWAEQRQRLRLPLPPLNNNAQTAKRQTPNSKLPPNANANNAK
jgi:hypothetical protein